MLSKFLLVVTLMLGWSCSICLVVNTVFEKTKQLDDLKGKELKKIDAYSMMQCSGACLRKSCDFFFFNKKVPWNAKNKRKDVSEGDVKNCHLWLRSGDTKPKLPTEYICYFQKNPPAELTTKLQPTTTELPPELPSTTTTSTELPPELPSTTTTTDEPALYEEGDEESDMAAMAKPGGA